MATRDLVANITCRNALNTAAIASDTTTAGAIIDTRGYESLTFVIKSGTITDGTYTPLVQYGDDSGLSDAAAVPDAELLTDSTSTAPEAAAAFVAADDNTAKTIGYVGAKRYVRLSLVSTGTTTGGTIGAVAVLGHAHNNPAV